MGVCGEKPKSENTSSPNKKDKLNAPPIIDKPKPSPLPSSQQDKFTKKDPTPDPNVPIRKQAEKKEQ